MHLSSPSHAPPTSHHPFSLSLPAHAPKAGTNKKHALFGQSYTWLDTYYTWWFIIYCTIAQKSVVWGFIFLSLQNFSPKLWWNYNYGEWVFPNSSNNVLNSGHNQWHSFFLSFVRIIFIQRSYKSIIMRNDHCSTQINYSA